MAIVLEAAVPRVGVFDLVGIGHAVIACAAAFVHVLKAHPVAELVDQRGSLQARYSSGHGARALVGVLE